MKTVFSLLIALTLAACSTQDESQSETRVRGTDVLSKSELKAATSGQVSFTQHVKPILEAKCVMCHQSAAQPGRMSLASREEAQRTGTLGTFILPGKPDQSRFLTHLRTNHSDVKAMPPVGETLTDSEVALLRRWIEQGAFWPTGTAGRLKLVP